MFTITEQNNWIKTLYQLSNGYLLTGSQDQKIRVWNNFKIIKELASHRKSIRSFCQIYNNNFASASFDKTIKIWDINKFEVVQTLEGHNSNVICILYHSSNCLISCSSDHTIKIWKN